VERIPISQEKAKKAIRQAPSSNIAKSVRRIYFTGLYESAEKRGYWHTDIMSGMGSGILIKFDNSFFLLTAKHVLKDLLKYNTENGEFPNESPFWIDVCHKPNWDSLYDFLMPKRIWDIGQLIKLDEKIVTSDVLLVELFPPAPLHFPDNFIDITEKSYFLEKSFFYTGQYLFLTGYPFEKNNYDWTVEVPNFTHGTKVHRVSYLGTFQDDSNIGFISFEIMDGEVTHENSKGMSGGVIYNVQENLNDIKLCGMILTASNNICHFLPSYVLLDAIVNYKTVTPITVDPMAEQVINPKDRINHIKEYYKTFTSSYQSSVGMYRQNIAKLKRKKRVKKKR